MAKSRAERDFYGFRFVNGPLLRFFCLHERPMLIVCPTCATTYQIQLAALGTAGRSVRCSHCKNSWFATADSPLEEAEILSVSAPDQHPAPPPPIADDFALRGSDEV